MKHLLLSTALLFVFAVSTSAQMKIDGVTLYGNEWIDYDKTYWKITVSKDDMYKVTVPELRAAGFPVDDTPMSRIQAFYFGNNHPIYRSTEGIGGDSDYILFYGVRNRSELDQYIYTEDVKIFNTEYSLINDESAYFLTVSDTDVANKIEMVEANLTGNTLQPEPYYIHEETVVFSEFYYKPVFNSNIQFSTIMGSEGFGGKLAQSNTFEIPSLNIVSDFSPHLSLSIGANNVGHKHEISLNGNLIYTYETDFALSKYLASTEYIDIPLTVSNLEDSNTISLESVRSESDKNRVGSAKLKYGSRFIFQRPTIVNLPTKSSARYVELEGWAEDQDVFVYFPDEQKIYKTMYKNGRHAAILSGQDKESKVYIYEQEDISESVNGIDSRTYMDYSEVDHDYILLTHKDLMTGSGGEDYVQQYVDFRSSQLGGGFDPIIVDIDQLYDQFGYGVDRHYISVRNFNHFVKKEWSNIRFLFIVGQSLQYELHRSIEQHVENENNFFVPTFGTPGSDILLVSTSGNTSPLFALGRLAAKEPSDVKNYLDKVRVFAESKNNPQTIEDKLWMKNVIHLSGGTSDIRGLIARNLGIMGDTITGNKFGANVVTFYKESSEAIEQALSEQIFNTINEGSSILTFFGHSAVNTFDFSLDDVKNYENTGKYPVVLSLGCFSGNIHTTADIEKSVSKEFVLTPEKGSVAFLASTGAAYLGQQYVYARDLYSKIGREFYGEPIGEAVVNVIRKYSGGSSTSVVSYLQQLALHGDPAITLLDFEGPDAIVDEGSVYTEPQFVDTYQEEFKFCFDIVNLGQSTRDSIDVNIVHLNPKSEVEMDSIMKIMIPPYRTQHCMDIPLRNRNLLGENTINVTVDPENKVTEYPTPDGDNNNKLVIEGVEGYKFYILSNSAIPSYPKEYSIVNDKKIMLVASTYNAFGSPQSFNIQIDTTKEFNSPYLKTFSKENVRGTFEQEVNILDEAEVVYYWRVSQDSTIQGIGVVWSESSFVYVPEVGAGWNHSHYHQFIDNELTNMEYRDRKLKYVDNLKDVRVLNKIRDATNQSSIYVNEAEFDKWQANINAGVGVVIFDPIKGKPWRNYHGTGGLYGSTNNNSSSSGWTIYFEYKVDTQESEAALVNLLKNEIPDGYNVIVNFLLKTNQSEYPLEDWMSRIDQDGSLFNTLREEGANDLFDLTATGIVPYVFGFIKGPEDRVLAENIAPDKNTEINTSFQIVALWSEGNIKSTKIGPSLGYSSLEWLAIGDMTDLDTIGIDIVGVGMDNVETVLYENITTTTFDLSQIDPTNFPFLRLIFHTKDEKNFTTAQASKLRVFYKEVPDITLIAERINKEKYQEGESMMLKMKLVNNSESDMPPFDISYITTNAENETKTIRQQIGMISAHASITDDVTIDTRGLKGAYVLQTISNVEKSPMEQYYFNNLGLSTFTVDVDRTNPVLDVTFDGITIMENDIVSAQPLINIELKDENKYLLLDDTSSFNVLVENPTGIREQVLLNGSQVAFYPADNTSNNKARIEYSPKFEEDGSYKLIVEARDATENTAGKASYEVSFRVFNQEMVSNVFNYPNPFSTSTQFIFTLTGDEDPSNILIRIMTVTGKVVKEITMTELGNVHIGLNKTDYKWDGRDEYGDRLANGVYLYQVITKKMDGSNYDHFSDPTENNTDHLFKDGFGKMVIMK